MQIFSILAFALLISFQSSFVNSNHTNYSYEYKLKLVDKFVQNGPFNIFWSKLETYLKEEKYLKNLSTQCETSLRILKSDHNKGKIWAHQLVNSNPGTLIGLFQSILYYAGNFDQCIWSEDSKHNLQGRYFLASLLPKKSLPDYHGLEEGLTPHHLYDTSKLNLLNRLGQTFLYPQFSQLKIGVCLPSGCDSQDVAVLYNQALKKYHWYVLNVTRGYQNKNIVSAVEEFHQEHPFIYNILRCYLYVIFTFTLLDYMGMNFGSFITDLTNRLSIKSNWNKLMSPNEKEDPYAYIFDTIRYVFAFLTILLHTGVYSFFASGISFYGNFFNWLISLEYPSLQIIYTNTTFSMLFIMASGTMSAKMSRLANKNPTKSDMAKELLIRLLRFWPTIAIMICLEIAMPFMYSGPAVQDVPRSLANNCLNYGWKNLLFVNNLQPVTNLCLLHTWSNSAELQLLAFSCLLTYVYSRSKRLGYILNTLYIVVGIVINFVVIYTSSYNALFFGIPLNLSKIVPAFNYLHLNFITHFPTYFIIYMATRIGHRLKTLPFTKNIRKIISFFAVFHLITGLQIGFVNRVWHFKNTAFLNAIIHMYYSTSLASFFGWMIIYLHPIVKNPNLGEEFDSIISFWISLLHFFSVKKPIKETINENASSIVKKEIEPVDLNNNEIVPDQTSFNEKMINEYNQKINDKKPKKLALNHVISRLIRPMYFVHHFLIIYFNFSTGLPSHLTLGSKLYDFPGTAIICLFWASVFYVLVDAPTQNLMEIFINQIEKSQFVHLKKN